MITKKQTSALIYLIPFHKLVIVIGLSNNNKHSLICHSFQMPWSHSGTIFCKLLHSTVTCKDLTQSGEVEETAPRHGEQQTQEHQEGDRWEDHWENH